MIQIGLNENVYLKNAQLDATSSALEITFDQLGAEGAKEAPKSYFDVLAADGEVVETGYDTTIRLFAPTPPKDEPGKEKTQEKKVELLVSDINKSKGILLHLLSGYFTKEELKGKINPFKGLNLDNSNFNTEILKKEVLLAIHRNMATDFIAAAKPFFESTKPEHLFRLVLVRQSKDKHYATFRGRFIEDNPWWESMQVPAEASKVAVPNDPADPTKGYKAKFTKYELDNNLDSSAPVSKDKAAEKKDGNGSGGAAPLSTSSVFG